MNTIAIAILILLSGWLGYSFGRVNGKRELLIAKKRKLYSVQQRLDNLIVRNGVIRATNYLIIR